VIEVVEVKSQRERRKVKINLTGNKDKGIIADFYEKARA